MAVKQETKTVLIIEDDADVMNFIARVLELEGYQVLKSRDGERGIMAVRENPVALVLMDLRLPGRDGWSLLEEIKSKPEFSSIPVVVVTASVGLPQKERAVKMGAADFITKPLSAAILRETVNSILFQAG